MRPSKYLLYALVAWMLIGLLGSVVPSAVVAWAMIGAVVLLLAIGDAIGLALTKTPGVERKIVPRFAVGIDGEATLEISNPNRSPLRLRVFDGLPTTATSEALPWEGAVPGRGSIYLDYPVRFLQRGEITLEKCHLLVGSPLRLWHRAARAGEAEDVRVYPNYAPVVGLALAAMENRDDQMGIVSKNAAGLSREFHQLREYHEGDTLSQVDWKASAKHIDLISRDYQEQRDQNIILVVDRGRRMRAMDGDLAQFDHCLNAMLLLSYVALKQGDKIGILGFGGEANSPHNRWLPPVKGQASMTTILDHLYDYETSSSASDFSEAVRGLMLRQQRRALVVLLTNLRSEDTADLLPAARLLRQKHLVVIASLRESQVDELDDEAPHDLKSALTYGAAARYREERREMLDQLETARIICVDEPAQDLPIALANRYLEIKASGTL